MTIEVAHEPLIRQRRQVFGLVEIDKNSHLEAGKNNKSSLDVTDAPKTKHCIGDVPLFLENRRKNTSKLDSCYRYHSMYNRESRANSIRRNQFGLLSGRIRRLTAFLLSIEQTRAHETTRGRNKHESSLISPYSVVLFKATHTTVLHIHRQQ